MRSQILTALLLLATRVFSAPAPDKDSDCDFNVKSPQSIQEAINKAKKGNKIVVEAGNYHEQLTITTDGIQLIGRPGATLLPPQSYTKNFCTGLSKNLPPPQGDGQDTEAGICIYPTSAALEDYVQEHRKVKDVGDYIKNVVITGFEVHNFTGENIAVIRGKDVKVAKNTLVNGGQYGFLTVGSKNTLAEQNVVTSSSLNFIAMCMDDKSDAKFKENDISNYYIALCTQTPGGLVKQNKVKNCCIGPFVDPGIKGAKIVENTVSTRNSNCPTGIGPYGGSGIIVSGAQDTIVERNTFENFKNNGDGVGIEVVDGPAGEKASGNMFKKNVLRDNDIDISNNATGTDNVFKNNECVSSFPKGYCG